MTTNTEGVDGVLNGNARVSTSEQCVAIQLDALMRVQCSFTGWGDLRPQLYPRDEGETVNEEFLQYLLPSMNSEAMISDVPVQWKTQNPCN